MNLKLSLNGMRGRLKDYLILFSGLVISAAIFYVFQSIASNEQFLRNAAKSGKTLTQNIVVIFNIGSIFLGFIIFVYLGYANSFLLSMRQKVYAMYIMLGAKSRKVAKLFFIETLTIGILAVLSGIIVGIGLSQLVSQILVHQMELDIKKFFPWNLRAVIITAIFFLLVFILMAFHNNRKIMRTPILKLINESKTPNRVKKNRILWAMEILTGIVCLGVGYGVMGKLSYLINNGIFIAMFTIITGTYFVCDAFFIAIVEIIRSDNKFKFRTLRSFTLGQLSYRIRDFTKILSMVSILFALSLGAITVGIGFQKQIGTLTKLSLHYDLAMHDPTAIQEKEIAKLNVIQTRTYHYKVSKGKVTWCVDEFNKEPYYDLEPNGTYYPVRNPKVTGDDFLENPQKKPASLMNFLSPNDRFGAPEFLVDHKYRKAQGKEKTLKLYVLKDFMKERKKLKSLVESDNKKIKDDVGISNQRYSYYQVFNSIFSGLEFMGLFLGIAFLAMLASCLMFKILVGANSDVNRYQMLIRMGVKNQLLHGSIKKEIGVLFGMPAILGIIHVLFGLQMFKVTGMIMNPYRNLVIPFSIFIGLYFVYYATTVMLYNKLVIPDQKIK